MLRACDGPAAASVTPSGWLIEGIHHNHVARGFGCEDFQLNDLAEGQGTVIKYKVVKGKTNE